eukprot:gene336-448_t
MPPVLQNVSLEFDKFYAAQQDAVRIAKNHANNETDHIHDENEVYIPRGEYLTNEENDGNSEDDEYEFESSPSEFDRRASTSLSYIHAS